ncbi:hypothetical protein P170DRAFT_429599 [Aspergillus steynii IBT 23096]|uniref:C6 finger domain protein n=1 Tax=Aspergillus steynii IBT 23096 TaxID=1392250 RepID=A0A2I2FW71_9EURO|nr:uncharacterized protein P170DRAFT_429599 [Aspergillus steynii IBT 23096]PLB44864.1 hypothetical protein P170DRAFT_429599 [Aspergillus steynii IBT 23096]
MPVPPATRTSPGAKAPTRPPVRRRERQIGGSQRRMADLQPGLDFTNVALRPYANVERMRNELLRCYLLSPPASEIPEAISPFTVQYISCVLATYPRCMLSDGGLPPLVHRAQVQGQEMPRALANCFSLVRMWYQAVPGSEAMVAGMVEQEMERLAGKPPGQGDYILLCTFQAYLLYSIMIYFSPLPNTSALKYKTMITLSELACRTVRNGFSCAAEHSHTRPPWETWIVAASKRRTFVTMELFRIAFNAGRLLPSSVTSELGDIFASGNRALWEASDRDSWGREHDRYLLDWEDGMLNTSELYRPEATAQKERVERWVQSVDEFGMMLFAVCAHIRGR